MERYISNAIYDNTDQSREKCIEIAMIEREWFGRGVEEGIRLLLNCI
ncbi:MAG: hypothetical protein SPK14_02505 [Lachnospiraceae bacterium]|nr:hypothetical protein [Lachnospiraceae bacterium]